MLRCRLACCRFPGTRAPRMLWGPTAVQPFDLSAGEIREEVVKAKAWLADCGVAAGAIQVRHGGRGAA